MSNLEIVWKFLLNFVNKSNKIIVQEFNFNTIKLGVRTLKSIRTKIMAGIVCTVTVFLLIVGGVSIYMSYSSSVSQLEDSMKTTAAITASRIEKELEAYRNVAISFGARSDIAGNTMTTEEKETLMNQWAQKYNMTRSNILDANGIGLFDGNDYSDRDYYTECMKGNSYISTPVVSKVTGELTIIVAAPLWENGVVDSNVIGVVYFVPHETFLNDIVSSINISENGSAYMLDKNGNTIAHEDIQMVRNQDNTIADSIVSVERGSNIVDEVAGLMDTTAEGARAAVSIMDTISQETDNEAQAIKQVTVGIDQISSVVQTNSATAEQSAAASEELSGQANMLRELISGFKLRNVSTGSSWQSFGMSDSASNTSDRESVPFGSDKY